MTTFRVDLSGIPVSPRAKRWLAMMKCVFPGELVDSVLVYATTVMSQRGGRLVTREDLEDALAEMAAEAREEPTA